MKSRIFILLSGIIGILGMTACYARADVPPCSQDSWSGRAAAGSSGAAVRSDSDSGPVQSVVYESVSLEFYEESGWPYLHDIYTNNTEKAITGNERGMLAYDKDGNPLKLRWLMMDSSNEPAYEYIYLSDKEIPAGQTMNVPGGWSLYDGEKMPEWAGDGGPNKAAYALYCDKSITFSDGTVWENPRYPEWLSTYKGKSVPVEVLECYYPFIQAIE